MCPHAGTFLWKSKQARIEYRDKPVPDPHIFLRPAFGSSKDGSSEATFDMLQTAWEHFHALGFVIRSGLNYGGDFCLYEKQEPNASQNTHLLKEENDEHVHAKYVVVALDDTKPLIAARLYGIVRAVHQAHKTLLLSLMTRLDDPKSLKAVLFGQGEWGVRKVVKVRRWQPGSPQADAMLHPNIFSQLLHKN